MYDDLKLTGLAAGVLNDSLTDADRLNALVRQIALGSVFHSLL